MVISHDASEDSFVVDSLEKNYSEAKAAPSEKTEEIEPHPNIRDMMPKIETGLSTQLKKNLVDLPREYAHVFTWSQRTCPRLTSQ